MFDCIDIAVVNNGNGDGIYIPHFLYEYIQMRFTTHES